MALKSRGLAAMLTMIVVMGGVDAAGAVGLGGICGPILDGACDPGLFCERKAGTCGLIGGTGKCIRIPAVCPRAKPRIVLQVCGCNGVTYRSDCARIKAGMRKDHDGACK